MDIAHETRTRVRLISLGSDTRFVLILCLVIWLITAIPFLLGALTSPPEKQFMGVLFDVHDTTQYLSWMHESGTKFLIQNKLTSEPNRPIFFNLQWWTLGRLARYLGLHLLTIYQLFRLAVIPFFLFVTHRFLKLYFGPGNQTRRRLALLIIAFGGGLGWIWVVGKQFSGELAYPIDVYTIPGNSFFSMMSVPHVAFDAALITSVFILVWLGYERDDSRYSLAASLAALATGMAHIYDLVTIWAVLAVFGLLLTLRDGFSWRLFLRLFSIVVVSAPAALYYGYVSSAEAVWKAALEQFDNLGTLTPDLFHLLIFMGLPLILALVAFKGIVPLKTRSPRQLLVLSWFMVNFLLIYAPLKFQIMLLNGFQIPIAILATEALFDHLIPWLKANLLSAAPLGLSAEMLQRIVLALVVLAVLPTNLYLLGWRVVDLRRHDYPYYLYRDEVAAFQWLKANTDPDAVVLSTLSVGHYLAGLSGNTAFLASGVQTSSFNHKRELVEDFFDAKVDDAQRRAMIDQYGLDYVLHSPEAHALGDYQPGSAPFLKLVFEAPFACIYEVVE